MSEALKAFIEKYISEIESAEFKELFQAAQKTEKVNCRELFHILVAIEMEKEILKETNQYEVLTEKKVGDTTLCIYTDNDGIKERLNHKNGFELIVELVDCMKTHYSYIDWRISDDNKELCFDKACKVDLIIIVSSKEKPPVTTDFKLKSMYDECSRILTARFINEKSFPIDLVMLLAYHTLDNLKFESKGNMLVAMKDSLIDLTDNNEEDINDGIPSEQDIHTRKISELMGCYIDRTKSNLVIEATNHEIYLCKEYIEEFCELFFNTGVNGINVLFSDFMLYLVFLHECGHLIFSYLKFYYNSKKESEQLANFFASYYTRGVFDTIIKLKVEHQARIYWDPTLYSDDKGKGLKF